MEFDKIQGVLSGVKTVDEETVIVFGSAEYVVCDSYLEKKTIPSVASNVVVFLDYEGRAAGISVEAATSGYAFVLKSYVDEAMNEPYVRLFTQDGTKTDCGFAKKITIDGEVYTKGTAGFSEYIKSFGDYKLIKYKINADNEIKFMDTVEEGKGTADDSLRCLYNMPSQPVSYFDQVSYFSEGKLAINSDTIIIEIPPVENKTNYDAYKLSSVSGFGVKYYVAGYTSDPDGFVAEVLLKQSSGGATDFTGNGPCLLIEEIVDTIDEDDHAVKVLKGWRSSDNKQVEITIAADCTFKNVSGTEALDSVEDLRVGEIIMYTTDADGRISYFEVMKRMNRDGLIGDYDNGGKYASWPSDAGFACSWGYLIARDETMIGLVKTKAQLSGITNPDVIYNITTNTSIYHVSDDSKTKITPISRDNLGVLTDYKHNYQTTEVICIGGNTHVKMLVVY